MGRRRPSSLRAIGKVEIYLQQIFAAGRDRAGGAARIRKDLITTAVILFFLCLQMVHLATRQTLQSKEIYPYAIHTDGNGVKNEHPDSP